MGPTGGIKPRNVELYGARRGLPMTGLVNSTRFAVKFVHGCVDVVTDEVEPI